MIDTKDKSISIGITHTDNNFFLQMTIKGYLSHEDYQKMIPLVENALNGVKDPKVKVLVDAREFEGWELKAVLDDFKFGLKHNKEFVKVAFVGNKKWEKFAIRISNWFMSGKMEFFEDLDSAKEWLKEDDNSKEILKTEDSIEKEFLKRKDEIKKELKFLFNANMRITEWDVAESDQKRAKNILLDILQEGIDELKSE